MNLRVVKAVQARALIAAIAVLLAVTGAAAARQVPWTTLALGAGTDPIHSRRSTAAVVIGSQNRLNAYPDLRGVGCCGWYDRFDWRGRAVLLVVAKPRHEFKVVSITRRKGILRVTIGDRYPDQADALSPITTSQALSVPRSLLGRTLPRGSS